MFKFLRNKLLLKAAFGIIQALLLRYARNKYWYDELQELIEEIREREGL